MWFLSELRITDIMTTWTFGTFTNLKYDQVMKPYLIPKLNREQLHCLVLVVKGTHPIFEFNRE